MLYREKIKDKLISYYDIDENVKYGKYDFDFVAKYNQRNAKYVLSKRYEYYAFTNNNYILYKKLDTKITKDTLDEIKSFLSDSCKKIIKYNDEHMSSNLTIILETEIPRDRDLIKKVLNFKFYKSFVFGLKGWVNAGLVLIDPDKQEGLTNKSHKKELKKFII